jgi:hypothetical protein
MALAVVVLLVTAFFARPHTRTSPKASPLGNELSTSEEAMSTPSSKSESSAILVKNGRDITIRDITAIGADSAVTLEQVQNASVERVKHVRASSEKSDGAS